MEENGYRICDAESDSTSSITVDRGSIIPLPTSLPDRNIKAVEFPPKTRVLSLFPESNDSWTSVFYEADVVKPPSETGSYYKLKFLDDSGKSRDIPPKHIVELPR